MNYSFESIAKTNTTQTVKAVAPICQSLRVLLEQIQHTHVCRGFRTASRLRVLLISDSYH